MSKQRVGYKWEQTGEQKGRWRWRSKKRGEQTWRDERRGDQMEGQAGTEG